MLKANTIGIDFGSSAIKGVLASSDGRLLASTSVDTELDRPAPGHVVFSSPRSYELLCGVFRTLVKASGRVPIAAVALSGAAGDTLLMDLDGTPLLPAIHWMDTRSINDPAVDPPGMTPADIHHITGWPWGRCFPLAHLAWLKTHEPDAFRRARRVGMNLTYLYHRLCGAWAMDHSTASTFYLQDQRQKAWHPPFLAWLGLDANQLPALHESGSAIGRLSRPAASETGLPEDCAIVLGAFDHPSAARGSGTTRPGDLLLSLGTSWVGFYPVPTRELPIAHAMLADPFLSEQNGPWGAIFALTKAGEKLGAALLAAYPDAPDAATRHARIEQDLRTALQGGASSSPAVALVLELIRDMKRRMDSFAANGIPTSRLVLVGGPSANAAIVDGFRREMRTPIEVAPAGGHSGALGAAHMATNALSRT